MLEHRILAKPLSVLTQEQRLRYFEDGALTLLDYVPATWLKRLREAMQEVIERSRECVVSDKVFVLAEGHSSQTPILHRISSPQDQHPVFWEFFTSPLMTDLVSDVVGPDVKFHHAKLNIKSDKVSRAFEIHQDIPGWPHTDYSPVTVGIYLDGCTLEMGPLSYLPGSHRGPLYSLYDKQRKYTLRIDPTDVARLDMEKLVSPVGGPGTVLLLNCRTIHCSSTNTSDKSRPLLLPVYSSADSFPYTTNPIPSPHSGDIVRGRAAQFASFDPLACELPPDFRHGYKSQFEVLPSKAEPTM